jgi:hypothetical protein
MDSVRPDVESRIAIRPFPRAGLRHVLHSGNAGGQSSLRRPNNAQTAGCGDCECGAITAFNM